MEIHEKKRFVLSFVPPLLFVLLITLIKTIEVQFQLNFGRFGILPREISGLRGILLSPLIHGDWKHLFNNSIPLLILGWALFYFYKSIAVRVFVLSYFLAGLYTWISARNSFHIGASGVVYALFGFIFISGFLRKYIPLVAVSFLVAFLYGSLIWGILPWDKGISWEGHFWGLFAGIILAGFYRKKGPQRKEYVWEEDIEEYSDLTELPINQDSESVVFKEINHEYHFVPKSNDTKNENTKP